VLSKAIDNDDIRNGIALHILLITLYIIVRSTVLGHISGSLSIFLVFSAVHPKIRLNRLFNKKGLILVDAEATFASVDDYSLLGTSIDKVILYNRWT
jgi:hypothetical protein